jgi:hypothetical protein
MLPALLLAPFLKAQSYKKCVQFASKWAKKRVNDFAPLRCYGLALRRLRDSISELEKSSCSLNFGKHQDTRIRKMSQQDTQDEQHEIEQQKMHVTSHYRVEVNHFQDSSDEESQQGGAGENENSGESSFYKKI